MVAFLEVGFFPRIHTAIAEWLACMLFILPQKKRFGESSWQQIGCCIGFTHYGIPMFFGISMDKPGRFQLF